MDQETVLRAFDAQLVQVRESALARAFDWTLDAEEATTLFVGMGARGSRTRAYLLRVGFDEFPRRAPSCLFVDPESRQSTDGSWPPGVKHGSRPTGICTPGTREFHEHYHRNDRQHVWEPDEYALLRTLAEINRLLERGQS